MEDRSILLLKHGFIKSKYKHLYPKDTDWSKITPAQARKHADEEIAEEALESFLGYYNQPYFHTGYPRPTRRYWLIMESFGLSIEETYFWILNHMRHDQGYATVEKITDIFSASVNSAFWGQSSQRLGIQQEKVSQYFGTVGKLLKDLFQLVRELRIIDERLLMYEQAEDRMVDGKKVKGSKSADVTLKGLYIDLVEGGTEKPTSVYGMSQKVGFTILPDLYFNTRVYDVNKLDKVVEGMPYNPQVKNVLKRKLFQFIVWKQKTGQELKNRRKFNLRYLRQHWGVIKMYMGWIKPYLKNIQRLSMSQRQMESPDVVSAFETSMLEVEFVGRRAPVKGYHPCIMASFKYTTKPTMSYQQEYQRGPIHVGRVEVKLRSYAWTPEQLENYKKMRNQEDLELLGIIDQSVQAAMEELGEELHNYLEEAGEQLEKQKQEEEQPKKRKTLGQGLSEGFDPFVAVFKGFGELISSLAPISWDRKKKKKKVFSGNPKAATGMSQRNMWLIYKNYKKAHKLLTW